MRPIRIIAVIFLFAIVFCGCKKEVLEVHPELEGIWNSEYYTSDGHSKIVIEENGHAMYEKKGYNASPGEEKESGTAKIKKDVLKIGHAEFKITAYPAYDSDGNYFFETAFGKYFGAYAVINPQVSVTGSNALFSWTFTTTPADWSDDKQIDYRMVPNQTWTSVTCPGSPSQFLITGLSSGTFEYRLKSTRGNHSSQYSPVQTFIIP